jgi:hypothetical protein
MDARAARDVLLAKGVPGPLLDAIAARRPPFRFLAWSAPNLVYANELERVAVDLRGMCPIAEENGEAVIALLPDRGTYISCYYEDASKGHAASEILGQGYRQFAARILLRFEESGLRDELVEAAAILQFEEFPQLLQLLEADPYDDDAVQAFVRGLAD